VRLGDLALVTVVLAAVPRAAVGERDSRREDQQGSPPSAAPATFPNILQPDRVTHPVCPAPAAAELRPTLDRFASYGMKIRFGFC
jgi:hypothetical protein